MNKEKIAKVLKKSKIKLFNRWRSTYKILDIDLIASNLSGSDLSGVNLRGSDLRNSDLSHTNLSGSDLKDSNLSHTNLKNSDLSGSDLRNSELNDSDLTGANLDFSTLHLSCKSLSARFDKKHIIQILYHACMPCQNNNLELDHDLERLLNSKRFKRVVNKFHIPNFDRFEGTYKRNVW